jgi:hypothetical protein
MAYDQGGGGGKASSLSENDRVALGKLYELEGEMTPEKVAQLNEMLTLLFHAATQTEGRVIDIEEEEDPEAEDQVVLQATVNITESQLESGGTSPITLVAAVTGKVIVPISAVFVVTTTVAYTSSPQWRLRYAGIVQTISGAASPNLQATVTARGTLGLLTVVDNSSDPTGVALVLSLQSDPTGTGTATAKIHVAYYLADSITSV